MQPGIDTCSICPDPIRRSALCAKHWNMFRSINYHRTHIQRREEIPAPDWIVNYRPASRAKPVPYRSLSRKAKDQRNQKTYAWRARNRARHIANYRAWRERNREHCNTEHRKWIKANLDSQRLFNSMSHCRRHGAKGAWTIEQWQARVAYYGWHCFYCRKELNRETLTVDHRIPLSKGGLSIASNMVPCCGRCNSSKGNKRHYAPKS